MMTSTRSLGSTKPPAPVETEISVATARFPAGRSDDMMRVLESTTFSGRTGSPSNRGNRTTAPVSSVIALGFLASVMKLSTTLPCGQGVQRTELSFRRLPTGKLTEETRTLTVGSFWMIVSAFSITCFAPEICMATRPARPAATRATERMTIRDGFMLDP